MRAAWLLVVAACGTSPVDAGSDAQSDAPEDAPPSWLGDAGLLVRPPSVRTLREICGIASNPGDMPVAPDAASTALRKGYFEAALDLGGVAIRRDFVWNEIEPARGTFDFAAYDALVAEAQARGVRLLGTLDYGNPWANASSMGDPAYPPTDPADFGAFAKAVAARYAGKVTAWEIWNEPNNGFRFWKPTLSGDPKAYAALLRASYAAIHSADPSAKVMFAGTVFTPQLLEGAMQWLEEAYAADPGLASAFDLMGAHTYMAYPPVRAPELGELTDAPLEAKIQMHAWMLARHGGESKPIWITELGWPIYSSVDEAAQARFLVRATLLSARAGADAVTWYTLRDGPKPNDFPPEDAFGLMRHDSSPKPAYAALRALLTTFGDRRVILDDPGVLDLPPDGRAVRLRQDGRPDAVAVWTVTSAARARLASGDATVLDQYGAPRGATAQAGFDVGPDVTYLLIR